MLGKMAFITSRSANCQKTDVGPMLFLDLNYDIGKLTSGRHLTDVGKDEIHDKSANDQKIDVGPTLLFRPNYDIEKLTSADIWPMSEKMTFKTSRQTVRKLMLGQRRYFDLIMISQN